jgi:hypothetical protein
VGPDQNSLAYVRQQSDECPEHRTPGERRLHDMTIFTIDQDNNITAFASAAEARSKAETERFRSAKDLAKLAPNWPATRLVEIWNSLPGVSRAHRFRSRTSDSPTATLLRLSRQANKSVCVEGRSGLLQPGREVFTKSLRPMQNQT